MLYYKKIPYYLILIICIQACSKFERLEKVQIESKLVVLGILRPGVTPAIRVSKSLSLVDNAPLITIKNAKLLLFENGNKIDTGIFNVSTNKYSFLKTIPKVGFTYKIIVNAEGFKDVEASTTIPQSVKITDGHIVIAKQFDKVIFNGVGADTQTYFTDATAQFNVKDSDNIVQNCLLIRANYLYPNSSSVLVQDWVLRFPGIENFAPYEADYISNNITYTGYHAYGNTTWILNAPELRNKAKQFVLESVKEEVFLKSKKNRLEKLNITVETFSPELYNYYRTVYLYYQARNNYFSLPVQIPSNVVNGYGIFGSHSTITEYNINIPQ